MAPGCQPTDRQQAKESPGCCHCDMPALAEATARPTSALWNELESDNTRRGAKKPDHDPPKTTV